jgi:membrane dipeptidase
MSIRLPALVLLAATASVACSRAPAGEPVLSDVELTAQARAIHERVITIDTHADIPLNFATAEVDPGVRGSRQVDLPKMREGGLDAAFFIVYVGQTARTPENYRRAQDEAMTKFNAIRRMAYEMYPGQIELAYSSADVERIHGAGKQVACIGIENGYVIGRDLGLMKKYHELGARYFGLTHNGHNDIGDSTNPRPALGDAEAEHGGLSAFGRQVVEEANRLGFMIDVSHAAKTTMMDAVRLSKAPVIASHSGTRAIADVARNLDDEQLIALKENGGVMQTVALGAFVKVDPPEKTAAVRALREEMGITGPESMRALSEARRAEYDGRIAELDREWPPASLKDFVDHIDHAVKLIGIDHVGISSDFDGGGGIVGWRDATETLNVTIELVRRGYSEEEIRKLWGGNLLRVWRDVERVAAGMHGARTTD